MSIYEYQGGGWKDYWVYIVECQGNSYYIGVTNSVNRRINQHNMGINPSCYTYKRRPVTHQLSLHFNDIWEAIACEKRLKKWSRKKKEALIEGDIERLSCYAKRQTVFDIIYRYRSNTRRPILKLRGMRTILRESLWCHPEEVSAYGS